MSETEKQKLISDAKARLLPVSMGKAEFADRIVSALAADRASVRERLAEALKITARECPYIWNPDSPESQKSRQEHADAILAAIGALPAGAEERLRGLAREWQRMTGPRAAAFYTAGRQVLTILDSLHGPSEESQTHILVTHPSAMSAAALEAGALGEYVRLPTTPATADARDCYVARKELRALLDARKPKGWPLDDTYLCDELLAAVWRAGKAQSGWSREGNLVLRYLAAHDALSRAEAVLEQWDYIWGAIEVPDKIRGKRGECHATVARLTAELEAIYQGER